MSSGAGRMLAATICTPAQQADGELQRGIVFVHGLGSNRRGYVEYGERAAAPGGRLPGRGSKRARAEPRQAGDMSPAEHLQDVLAAWDKLTAHYRADPGRIGVCGSSYGACLAALAVRHRKVARLLLRAPTIVADDDLARPLRLRSCDRDPASASVLLGGLNRFHSPALVVESENDEVIPHETVEAYLNALPAAGHTVIANAAHALSRPEWREVFI